MRGLWVLILVLGCSPSTTIDPDPDPGAGADARPGETEFIDAGPLPACQQMDLLFVVDDSASMQDERLGLVANAPAFIDVLDNYRTAGGGTLDYRIGVTTTSRDVDYFDLLHEPPDHKFEQGDNGELLMREDCGMNKRWIEDGDNGVADTLGCAVATAPPRTLLEMPLLAVDWALGRRVDDGTNAGFIRDDALLAVVILTDEDDCSREDNGFDLPLVECTPQTPELLSIDHYISQLDTIKGGRDRWVAAVIADPPPTACSGLGQPAHRLENFVDAAGNSVFASICSDDLSSPLAVALAAFDTACTDFPPIE